MNCNCIKEIESKILEAHPSWNGKKVIEAKLEKVFTFNPTDIRTKTDIVIEVEGQKKKYEVGVTHLFCPFCGTKQSKEN